MKKFVIWVILPISLLGNVVSLSMVGYGCWAYQHLHRAIPSGASDMAIVTDVINVDKDGDKSSHLIANYDGGRLVIDDPRVVMPIQYQHPKIGDAIQVQASETHIAGMKMLRFSLARDTLHGSRIPRSVKHVGSEILVQCDAFGPRALADRGAIGS